MHESNINFWRRHTELCFQDALDNEAVGLNHSATRWLHLALNAEQEALDAEQKAAAAC